MIRRFKVYSPPHTKFAALHLVEQLIKLGHRAKFVQTINKYDPDIHILYNATSLHKFPKNYIVYQTEIHGSHYFNARYLRIIKGARAVWDYCCDNLHCYQHPKTSIVTPGVSIQGSNTRDIDFLFYGWVKGSERREKLVNQLQEEIGLKVVTNKLCTDIWDILRRTKIVINVHFYDHSPLELFRINEALSFGCKVISEGYNARYDSLVNFCKYEDIAKATETEWEMNQEISNLDNLLEVQNALKKL
jgi:hypothetical protein